jgi:hypothetical protein
LDCEIDYVLVSEELVELDDELVLLLGEVAALEIRSQVVDPPQPAALPAPQQPYMHIHISASPPIAAAMPGMPDLISIIRKETMYLRLLGAISSSLRHWP